MGQAEATVIEEGATLRSPGAGFGAVHVGRVVFAATSVAAAVAFTLDVDAGNYRSLLYDFATVGVALLGLLLTTRVPTNRVSWVMAVAALWWAVASLIGAYGVEALVERRGSLPAGPAAAWFDNWAWLPGLVLFLSALIVLVPDGHLLSSRWWPVPVTVAVGTVLASAWVSTDAAIELAGTPVDNPLGGRNAAVGGVGATGFVLVAVGMIASLVAFVIRYRRSRGDARQQLGWVVVSLIVAVFLAVVGAVTWDVLPGAPVLPAAALLVVPAGISVAILKYRLYDLDLVVNRALVYTVLTVGVAVTYVAVVGLVGTYLSRRGDLLVSLALTGIVAVGFQPARERVQRAINRLMYGHRGDPYLAIAALSRSLAGSLRIETVLPAAVETIGRTLALHYVAVAVPADLGQDVVAAEFGAAGDAEILAVPLVHHDSTVGELRLSPRTGEQLRQRDHRLIADLVPQVAAAVHAVTLSGELQVARQRLVELREEERRRIRRDLHDGLGPALAGLTLTLEAVRNLTDSDHERADHLLASATDQVQTLIGDVRTLIYGLRPPALDELGLAASIRALAARDSTRQFEVTVEAPVSLPELPAAVEVAAYWIVQEALTNVRKHARAQTCTILLAVEPTVVRARIEDDGVGLLHAASGLGLSTMRERAAELGGICEIGPGRAGGTLVFATLPRLPTRVGR
jgi:signal transduction histidine kinase